AACIDACDQVMDRLNWPRGLVRYSTQHAVDHQKTHLLRPRVLIYGGLLAALISAVIVVVSIRTPLAIDILQDRKTLYREVAGGLQNVYQLKLMNKSEGERIFRIEVDPAGPYKLIGDDRVLVAAGGVANVALTVEGPVAAKERPHRPSVSVYAEDDPTIRRTESPSFLGPEDRR
ncbi:MAG: cytochrome c oxidase accessory protein CcoG, partial [Xanthomonadales bacterium]|nr:cytochrome c oxidase accessory protein CcoG [Xanthomonadales bacterium]